MRLNGEAFRMPLVGLCGRHFDADGRAIGSHAVLRVREVSGDRLELIALRQRMAEVEGELAGLCALLDASSAPVWVRDRQGALIFVNNAYARAVEAKDVDDAVSRGLELLDQPGRELAASAAQRGGVWHESLASIVAGQRHLLDVTQAVSDTMIASMAIDRHEVEVVRATMQQQMQSHVRTLDQLPTAVVIFDRERRLVYSNDAYATLWQIDAAFLEQKPSDGELLDWLRAKQRLPIEGDYRLWKERLFDAYRSTEAVRHT